MKDPCYGLLIYNTVYVRPWKLCKRKALLSWKMKKKNKSIIKHKIVKILTKDDTQVSKK